MLYLNNTKNINFSALLLVGVFSTHITYIILAIVYIFGYGTYALNLKKNSTEEIELSKVITVNDNKKSLNNKNDFHYYSCNKKCVKTCNKPVKRQNFALPYKRQKLKLLDRINWSSYNSTLPNITRPSPLLA